jgi:HPt (histidine-containing phosphotransfer) domain-containing protein
MTAHAMKGDRERCLAAGMDHYLSKPIRAARLTEAIATAMTLHTAAGRRDCPAVPAEGDGQIIDWSEALHSVNGDQRLLRDIVEAFLDESPRLLATIRSAIEQQDGKTLQRAAHTLKGSTRYFGAMRVSEMALQLESMGARATLTHARDTLVDVEREMARLTPLLVEYMRSRAIVRS